MTRPLIRYQPDDDGFEPFWWEVEPGLWSPISRLDLVALINAARLLTRPPGAPDPRHAPLIVPAKVFCPDLFLVCVESNETFTVSETLALCMSLGLVAQDDRPWRVRADNPTIVEDDRGEPIADFLIPSGGPVRLDIERAKRNAERAIRRASHCDHCLCPEGRPRCPECAGNMRPVPTDTVPGWDWLWQCTMDVCGAGYSPAMQRLWGSKS